MNSLVRQRRERLTWFDCNNPNRTYIEEKGMIDRFRLTLASKNLSFIGDIPRTVQTGGGGGYSHTLPMWVCAAQRGRDFEAPDLERGIHFRGVF